MDNFPVLACIASGVLVLVSFMGYILYQVFKLRK